MQHAERRPVIEQIAELSRNARYSDLAAVAERVAHDEQQGALERSVALVLWGYSMLRQDAYQHRQTALAVAGEGMAALPSLRDQAPDVVDWAMVSWGQCCQLAGDHSQAMACFEAIASNPQVAMRHRIKAVFSAAHSLHTLGREEEAREMYCHLAEEIDSLPADSKDVSILRERQRIRINLADLYLSGGAIESAEAELRAVDRNCVTPLMEGVLLSAQARAAMMQDRWADVEVLANQALNVALAVNYVPLRVEVLGILVAVTARQNRRDEQMQFIMELATLAVHK